MFRLKVFIAFLITATLTIISATVAMADDWPLR